MNEELENLLAHSVEYATDLLNETGDCYPYGAFIDTIGNVHPLEMEIDPKKVPTIGQVIENLKKYCEEEMKASKMNGYALAYEVSVQLEADAEPTDAIAIDMKHLENEEPPLFYLPFTTIERGVVEVGELFGVQR